MAAIDPTRQVSWQSTVDPGPIGSENWPRDGLEAQPACPLCASEHRTLLHANLQDRIFFSAPGTWSLWRCNACGGGFLDPRPTADSIGIAYRDYYTHAPAPNKRRKSREGLLTKLKDAAYNGYVNGRYGTNHRPALPLLRQLAYVLLSRKREKFQFTIRHLPTHPRAGKLVDIGCGNGSFLRAATHAGWDAWGIDPDPGAVEACRQAGLRVTLGGFPDTELPSSHFDYVTLSHVIEHVHDPVAALREIHRILKPGGQLWLATPNLDASGHGYFGSAWRGLEPPRHLVLFTLPSLLAALKEAGFIDFAHKKPPPGETPWFFQTSYRILRNENPNTGTTSLPIGWATRSWLASINARRQPGKAETLILQARRPL